MQENNESTDEENTNMNTEKASLPSIAQENSPSTLLTTSPPVKEKGKKKLLLALLLVVAAGATYAILSPKKSSAPTGNTAVSQTTNQQPSVPVPAGPQTLVYSTSGLDYSALDLFWSPLDSDKPTPSTKLGSKTVISQQAIRGEQVAFSTQSTYGGTAAPAIWYSSDGGKTYSKIFEDNKKKTDQTLGSQLTDLVFSNDGKSIIFAYLPEDGNNVVKQLLLDKPYTVKDLLQTSTRGIFIKAYDASLKQLIYSEGCYNCDGNRGLPILQTNVDTKATKTLVPYVDTAGSVQVVARDDAKELLILRATQDTLPVTNSFGGGYDGPPYSLSKLDVANGKETAIMTFGKKGKQLTGDKTDTVYATIHYMADGKTPYYISDKQIFKVSGNNSNLLFEAAQPIIQAYYVSDSQIYTASGEYNKYILNKFDISTKTNTVLLNGTDKTTIFGITTK